MPAQSAGAASSARSKERYAREAAGPRSKQAQCSTHASAGSNPTPAGGTAHQPMPQGHPRAADKHECTHTHTCGIRGRRPLGRQSDQLWDAGAAPPGQGAAVRPATGDAHARKHTVLPHRVGHQPASMHPNKAIHCSCIHSGCQAALTNTHAHARQSVYNTLKRAQHRLGVTKTTLEACTKVRHMRAGRFGGPARRRGSVMGAAPGCGPPGRGEIAGPPRRRTHLARVRVWHMTAVACETCPCARLVPPPYRGGSSKGYTRIRGVIGCNQHGKWCLLGAR